MKYHYKFFLNVPLLLFAILFISCTQQNNNANKDMRKIPDDKKSCLDAGGQWGRIGLYPEEQCNLPTNDGGKSCSDSKECKGTCIAELTQEQQSRISKGESLNTSGKCNTWKVTVGCIPVVSQGRVDGILCID